MIRNCVSMFLVAALWGAFLTGCATNRSLVNIQVPQPAETSRPNGKEVFIKSVTDARVFEENPTRQDIPSLGFGGAARAGSDIKSRAIGRKRNSFGKAMGDVLLDEGQTVQTLIRDALYTSFREKGYKIIYDENDISDNTFIVTVSIIKFWSYLTDGWSVRLSCDISTDITIRRDSVKNKRVSVYADGKYQLITDESWVDVVQKAVQEYIKEVEKNI